MMTGATYDMLILVSLKFEEDKWLCLGNDNKNDKTNKIPYKKQSKDDSATDKPLLLASQKSEGNQGWYLKNDEENNEINESL